MTTVEQLLSDAVMRGRASPTIVYHPVTDVRSSVHGDERSLEWKSNWRRYKRRCLEMCDVEVRSTLGSSRRDRCIIHFLGRKPE